MKSGESSLLVVFQGLPFESFFLVLGIDMHVSYRVSCVLPMDMLSGQDTGLRKIRLLMF